MPHGCAQKYIICERNDCCPNSFAAHASLLSHMWFSSPILFHFDVCSGFLWLKFNTRYSWRYIWPLCTLNIFMTKCFMWNFLKMIASSVQGPRHIFPHLDPRTTFLNVLEVACFLIGERCISFPFWTKAFPISQYLFQVFALFLNFFDFSKITSPNKGPTEGVPNKLIFFPQGKVRRSKRENDLHTKVIPHRNTAWGWELRRSRTSFFRESGALVRAAKGAANLRLSQRWHTGEGKG